MAVKKVTDEDIKKFNKLYMLSHNYSAVARITGFTPGTVKKYIIPDYEEVEEANITRYSGELPTFDEVKFFRETDWSHICELSEEEKEEMKNLWKELEL
jgi:hypothetical protein